MPLEIRELVIKATVDNSPNTSSHGGSDPGNTNESVLNEIAERVLEIIKEKSER